MNGHHVGGGMKDLAECILTLTQSFLQPAILCFQFGYFLKQMLCIIRQDGESPKAPKRESRLLIDLPFASLFLIALPLFTYYIALSGQGSIFFNVGIYSRPQTATDRFDMAPFAAESCHQGASLQQRKGDPFIAGNPIAQCHQYVRTAGRVSSLLHYGMHDAHAGKAGSLNP
jgi:hypothetical protein